MESFNLIYDVVELSLLARLHDELHSNGLVFQLVDNDTILELNKFVILLLLLLSE